MDRVLEVFLKFLRELRSTRGFVHHFFKRWALLLAFLGRKLGVWHPGDDGKGGTVTSRKTEQADGSFGGTRTQFDSREQAAAASCIPASARRPRTRHVSNATHPAPLTTVTPSPGHLTAAPHPGYASPSRSPSPREQLLPSIPPGNPGHSRRQSSNVAVAIESPSRGSFTLGPPTNTPTEDPYSIGSSTAHSSITSDAPHLQFPQLSTGTASTQPKPMNPDQVPRYTRRNTVQVDVITLTEPIFTFVVRPRKGTDYEIPALTTTFRFEQGQEDDCAPWVSATHPDGALYFYDSVRMLFTDTDMHDPVLRREIEARFLCLQDRLLAEESHPKNYDLTYDAKDMLSEVYWVGSPAHVKHRLEALYWSHWSLYPAFFEGRRLECQIYDELVGILSHGCVGKSASLVLHLR
ncbi:hypothetical protein EDB92DRAFT_1875046 [Lactarius akahatsu]|uniref:Uncharacterized protein n=1 Tax=Lactarius akahatsu TaxID=416441 RepID=A0AAD4LDP4_9AGAM|nr:hypothetical protein EDB92DRAFT_1875046 [Lactarius akahatsu]